MKFVFFGTPEYVLPILDSLHKEFKDKHGNSPITAVVTQPPKPIGRTKMMNYSAVDTWAHKKNIPVYFDSNELLNDGIEADLGIVASYGLMIPKAVLDYFPQGLLNIHPSNLPEFRGASPVQATLITGMKEATVSIMKVDDQMDHGPLVTQFKEEIKEDDTNESLRDRLFERSAEVLIGLIHPYMQNKITLKPQADSKATYTTLIKKEDGFIPYSVIASVSKQSLEINEPQSIHVPFIYTRDKEGNRTPYQMEVTPISIERFIRTMNPWPGAWTLLRLKASEGQAEKRLKILKAHVEFPRHSGHDPESTQINNLLILDEVQLEGKNPAPWKQFVHAYKLEL